MKEYKVIYICTTGDMTERYLNSLAKEGWKVICSYATRNEWIILERDREVCNKCKR